jgi:hypothetical protein
MNKLAFSTFVSFSSFGVDWGKDNRKFSGVEDVVSNWLRSSCNSKHTKEDKKDVIIV